MISEKKYAKHFATKKKSSRFLYTNENKYELNRRKEKSETEKNKGKHNLWSKKSEKDVACSIAVKAKQSALSSANIQKLI